MEGFFIVAVDLMGELFNLAGDNRIFLTYY